jgi:predicted acylesterase/phospholipase RssA
VSGQGATDVGRNGRIVTFYSYKGGTGRSMLLANVGWLLASQGKRVLTIDWDLEAPGLQRYFYPFLKDPDLKWTDGLINFVENYKTLAMTPPPDDQPLPVDWFLPHADIREYAISLQWDFPQGGRLDLVPAGRQDESYSPLVNSFNWEDFYRRLGGSRFLDAAANLMRRDYDYVLLDSRTGVSDTSGICTVKLPDALVVCFTLNYQSINGAAAVADFVYEQRVATDGPLAGTSRRRFNIFPVPMRLEDAQKRKLERRRDYARSRKFARYPIHLHEGSREEYWSQVGVRYDSFYAYEELLVAFGEKQRDINSLLAAAERFTGYLTEGVAIPLGLPQPRREEILRLFEGEAYEEPVVVQEGPAREAENAWSGLTTEQQEVARRVLLRLVRVAGPGEAEHSRLRVPLSDFEEAARDAIELLRRYQVLAVEPEPSAGAIVQIAPTLPPASWPRLQAWIDADRDFLMWRQALRVQAEQWAVARRTVRTESAVSPDEAPSNRLAGPALDAALTWLRSRPGELAAAERQFIEDAARRAEEQRALTSRRSELPARSVATVSRPAAAAQVEAPKGSADVMAAREILRGRRAGAAEILALAKRLKAELAFTFARRVLVRALAEPSLETDRKLRLRVAQECALCTYKDPDLPADERLDRALEILRRADDLATTKNQETLGLAGAVHKRKWEVDNDKEELERALHYYLRGYREDPVNDQGYTGINAAFVLDLLASLESDGLPVATGQSGPADLRRADARRIREDIVTRVGPLAERPENEWLAGAWWFYSTVAEALFGLQQHDRAVEWLVKGRDAVGEVPDWEYQSTLQQLARIALLQSGDVAPTQMDHQPAWLALSSFFRDDAAAVRSAFMGKVGLALSGGGFRAALYHIGVLAKLAEADVLRHVEVLSCVSGGSIVGAHYYLEVRHLLQSKPDAEVTRDDYIDIVRRLEEQFVAGVQRNVRTRVAAELLTNVTMTFSADYSRTLRVGELYESEIFARVEDGEGGQPRWLGGLDIWPVGEQPGFAPKVHNWRRRAKAPILVLNATTLNTGHNWQFTTAWMGEPPGRIETDIDGNEQLRRMYYWEAPEKHRRIRLGHAVAASSCVPGLFEPLAFHDLFPDRVVRLVDGGVSDNQGVSGLLEQDCRVMLVSDGSGQSESQPNPARSVWQVPLRSNAILQARVRDAQYLELVARRRSSQLRALMFVHLKEDLDVDPVDWVDCPDPFQASDDARPPSRQGPLTRYGISKEVQLLLAGIRTDLDSFSDVEARALMVSGYRVTEYDLKYSPDLLSLRPAAHEVAWRFLEVERGMKAAGRQQTHLKRLLAVSGALAFKVWRLSPPLKVLGWLLAAGGLGAIGALAWLLPQLVVVPEITALSLARTLVVAILVWVATHQFGSTVVDLIRWRDTLKRIAGGLLLSTVGCLAARLHLHLFDRLYLAIGSGERFDREGA